MKLQVQGREAFAYTGGKPFDAALPCVVLLHGALNDHSVFTLLARWLAHHGHGVLALDLPGHRRSEGPALPSIEAMADWVLAVLDAAGVQRATLGGHSMGSLVALQAAAQAPDRAERLLMYGTAYPMRVSAALLEASLSSPTEAIDKVVAFSHSTLGPKPSYPGPGAWLRGHSRALMHGVLRAQGDARLFHTDFTACDRYAGAESAALSVTAPVHLILGRHDQMAPPKAARTLEALLQAQVHRVDAGHSLMQEAPDAVLQATRDALASRALRRIPTPPSSETESPGRP